MMRQVKLSATVIYSAQTCAITPTRHLISSSFSYSSRSFIHHRSFSTSNRNFEDSDIASSSSNVLFKPFKSASLAPPPTLLLPLTSPQSSRALTPEDVEGGTGTLSSPPTPLFEITFLGTSSGRPTPVRNVSSVALRAGVRQSKLMLFDAGDGTQMRLLQARHLSLSTLSHIFITHLHGDHVFGLNNLIAAACNRHISHPLHVYGPQGIAAFVKRNLSETHTWMERPVIFHEVLKSHVRVRSLTAQPDVMYHQSPNYMEPCIQIYEDEDLVIHSGHLRHRDLNCLGYIITEKASALAPFRIAPRKAVILGDTCDSSSLAVHAKDADVLVHEATYLEVDATDNRPIKSGHSTAGMAGAFAKSINANHLILTHFSQRYTGSELKTGVVETKALEEHVQQASAQAAHNRVYAAQDLQVFHVAPRSNSASNRGAAQQPIPTAGRHPPPATQQTTSRDSLHIAMPKRSSPSRRQ